MPVARYQPANETSGKPLGEPLQLTFSKRIVKNRLFKAPMTEQLATWSVPNVEARGIPTKELIELYRRWGEPVNSFGMILTGSVTVARDLAFQGHDTIIDLSSPFSGPRFDGFKAIAAAGKASGSLIIGQICHQGRQTLRKFNDEVIAPSAVQLEPVSKYATPRAATQSEIDHVVASFAYAAHYLEAAGFDGVELHAAHGYLLAEFLTPGTNRRTDQYGGSLANRARIIVEIARAIRARVSPSFVLGMKLNSVEFQDGGFSPEEAAELCRLLQDEIELDFVELSGGTVEKMVMEHVKESTRKREAFFLEFAELIVPALGKTAAERKTKVYVTGGLRTVGAMAKALDVVDGVGIGRPATQEPRLASDILEGRVAGVVRPVPPFDTDLGLGLLMSTVQMRQVGKGYEPFDGSDAEVAKRFQSDVAAWVAAAEEDDEKEELHAALDFLGESEPYGAAH